MFSVFSPPVSYTRGRSPSPRAYNVSALPLPPPALLAASALAAVRTMDMAAVTGECEEADAQKIWAAIPVATNTANSSALTGKGSLQPATGFTRSGRRLLNPYKPC